jgi:hypothetical protein
MVPGALPLEICQGQVERVGANIDDRDGRVEGLGGWWRAVGEGWSPEPRGGRVRDGMIGLCGWCELSCGL